MHPALRHFYYSSSRGGYSIAFGDVYSKSSWSDLTDFSSNTTTAAIVGDKIQLSGGAGNFTQRLELDYISALENFTYTMQMVMGAKSTSSSGVAIGFKSNNAWTSQAHGFVVQIDNRNGGSSQEKVYAYTTVDNSTHTIRVNLNHNLTWGDTDVVELVLERAVNVFTIKLRNVTTDSDQFTTTYTYSISSAAVPVMPNTGRFTIYNFGGTITIQSIDIETTDKKYARIAVVGDSKTSYNAIAVADRWPNILAETYTDVIVLAGASSRTAEILTLLPEIIAFRPTQVLLNIGRNDIAQGVAQATWEANYTSIVSQIVAAGIRVKHLLPIEADGQDQSALETFINTNYSAADIITPPVVTSPDGTHPNAAGHASIASTIVSSGKII